MAISINKHKGNALIFRGSKENAEELSGLFNEGNTDLYYAAGVRETLNSLFGDATYIIPSPNPTGQGSITETLTENGYVYGDQKAWRTGDDHYIDRSFTVFYSRDVVKSPDFGIGIKTSTNDDTYCFNNDMFIS